MLPVYNPIEHLPPPIDLFPTLRLTKEKRAPWLTQGPSYRAYLTMELLKRLGLKGDQPIDLVPPSGHHHWWHLDLRKEAKNRVRHYEDTRPRIQGLLLPEGILGTDTSLTLRLVPGDPAFPGFYPLLPDAYFTPHQAPPLAAPRPEAGLSAA